jgi:Arc/MetJ-type ribon-helix-helix transcriptional regulator
MAKSIKVVPEKRARGRPATGRDPVTAIRLSVELRRAVDGWAVRQGDNPSRSEAIRRLVEQALSGSLSGPRSQKARSKAHELASTQLDKLIDPSAPVEEQQQGKRRLLKGPKEFQEIRNEIRSRSKR